MRKRNRWKENIGVSGREVCLIADDGLRNMSKSLDFTGIPRFPLHPSGVHAGVHEETGLTLIILLGGKVKHTPSFFALFI